jgi:hypothetical protein
MEARGGVTGRRRRPEVQSLPEVEHLMVARAEEKRLLGEGSSSTRGWEEHLGEEEIVVDTRVGGAPGRNLESRVGTSF